MLGQVTSLIPQDVGDAGYAIGTSGAFEGFSEGVSTVALNTDPLDGYRDSFKLNASLSSSIYGNSTKIQPRAFYALMIIKA